MEERLTSESENVASSASLSTWKGQSFWRTLIALTLLIVWWLIPTRNAPESHADLIDWLLYITYQAGCWCPIVVLFWVLIGKRSLEPTKDSEGKQTAGLSIWSTIVFMSLLAVWFAIPRHYNKASYLTHHFCWHQLALWSLVGTFAWACTGRRRSVLYFVLITVSILWIPILANLTEQSLTGRTRMTYSTMHELGIARPYGYFYKTLYELFQYGPRQRRQPSRLLFGKYDERPFDRT